MTTRTRIALHRWLPLAVLCSATFLLLVYATVVTVALPAISADLQAGFGAGAWIVDGYSVALAGLMIGLGALGDAVGHRRLFTLAAWGFGAATAACGIAPAPAVLIVSRFGQGVAAAALFAALIPLVGQTYRGRDRALAFAVWGSVAGAGGAAGTLVGGVLTEFLSWRWIFLGALPVCAGTALLSVVVLPRVPRRRTTPDLPGIVALSLAACALVFGVIAAGEHGWTSPQCLLAAALAAVAVVGLALLERRAPAPVLPAALVGSPTFAGLLLAAGGYYFAAFALLPASSLWLQAHAGLTALETALILAVRQVGFITTSALAGRRLAALPLRHTVGVGTLVVGVGAAALLAATALTPAWVALVPGLLITGIGAGVVSPVLPAAALALAPEAYAGAASSTTNSARQLGLALGIAVLGSLYHRNDDALTVVFLAAAVVGLAAGCGAMLLLARGAAGHRPLRELA